MAACSNDLEVTTFLGFSNITFQEYDGIVDVKSYFCFINTQHGGKNCTQGVVYLYG